MTVPLTLYEQMRRNWFEPNHRYAFMFGMSKFDAVYRKKSDGSYQQAFDDLETVDDDCKKLSECLTQYQIKTKNTYNLGDDPKKVVVEKALCQISAKIRNGKKKEPMDKFLIIFLFAGHGLQKDGMQAMLYNEYDKSTGFYKLFRAEQKLRSYAEIY